MAAARPATAHGGPGVSVRVLASDAAAYASAAELPSGFVACAEHRLAGELISTSCMRRDGDQWVYAIARASEDTWARSGQLADCASCHALVARGLYGAPAR